MKISFASTLMVIWALWLCQVAGTNPGGFAGAQEDTLNDLEVKLESFQDMAYPPIARMTSVQGVVVVRARLDDNGNVESAYAISGNKTLIPDTIANAKKWKFQPNSKKSAVIVYDFRFADGACHDNTHSLFELVHQNFASITTCSPVINAAP